MPNLSSFGGDIPLVIKARTDICIDVVVRVLKYYSSTTVWLGGKAMKSRCLCPNPGSATHELGYLICVSSSLRWGKGSHLPSQGCGEVGVRDNCGKHLLQY